MLELKGINKSFGGVKALKGVDLSVESGEIHALLGENGAGKSTLMKIISGAIQRDGGSIVIAGEEIVHNSPQIAKGKGVGIIYQEFSLVPDLTVVENIFLSEFGNKAWIAWDRLYAQADEMLQRLGFQIPVRRKVRELSVAEQQVVEIAKAIVSDVKLLILDEPSAVLGVREIHKLFGMLRRLRDEGVAIIYISHHLHELIELTDRITVLKDGASVATVQTADTTKDKLVELMIGRELGTMYPTSDRQIDTSKILSIEQMSTAVCDDPLSFEVYGGEILGIGGLVGSGRSELLQAMFDAFFSKNNRMAINGQRVSGATPGSAVKRHWGMVHEDRKRYGGLLDLSVKENISLAKLNKIADRWGFINKKKEHAVVTDLIARLKIKVGHVDDPLSSLSGGNQQKVVLAKWINIDPKVLLIDEPTRGVDVGARAEIYRIIHSLASEGVFVVVVSSDMDELMGISDRIMVLKDGRVQGILRKDEFSEDTLLRLAIGVGNLNNERNES